MVFLGKKKGGRNKAHDEQEEERKEVALGL